MTDLEDRIRELLDDDARSAPPPREPGPAIGRARRRQARSVAGGALGVLAVIAVALLAVRAVGPGRTTPAGEPTETTTIDGVSITHPTEWFVVDPDALGLNGPTAPGPEGGSPSMPRLVLAVSPTDQGELFGCPGAVGLPGPPQFLMTIQEGPVALTGDAAAPWPVPLEPMAIESAGGDAVESGDTGCYPGWEFLRAGWTTAGRTFEARVGFAPDVTEEDRAAVVAAYESLTFESGEGSPASVVLATGTAGGETWELVAERQADGLALSLNGESGGAGGGGFDPASSELFLLETTLGTGEDAQRVVFGAVPVGTAQVNVRDLDAEGVYEVLDVPDWIDNELDAFVFTTYPEAELQVVALDESGEILAMGEIGPARDPSVAPTPEFLSIENGRSFAFVRSVDVTTGVIEVDPAEWLTGEEAERAAAERGDEVNNDYYIVNDDGTAFGLTLAPDAELWLVDWLNNCCGGTIDGDLSILSEAVGGGRDVTDSDRVYHADGSWWITVRDGVVVRIEEQYRP
jgi:hypothetical protein